jgi:hypothetical protein
MWQQHNAVVIQCCVQLMMHLPHFYINARDTCWSLLMCTISLLLCSYGQIIYGAGVNMTAYFAHKLQNLRAEEHHNGSPWELPGYTTTMTVLKRVMRLRLSYFQDTITSVLDMLLTWSETKCIWSELVLTSFLPGKHQSTNSAIPWLPVLLELGNYGT